MVSGQPFAVQPVVTATMLSGETDQNFSDTVRVSLLHGRGSLQGMLTGVADHGTLAFPLLTYTAASDREYFVLQATDGDSSIVWASSDTIVADAVATRLLFSSRPPR